MMNWKETQSIKLLCNQCFENFGIINDVKSTVNSHAPEHFTVCVSKLAGFKFP